MTKNKNELIKISENFQASVNIAYDLHDRTKIRNFIPTSESIDLIETLFESVNAATQPRAHIIIGSYGKGKSHIVLEALNLLFEKDSSLFERLFKKIQNVNPGLFDDIKNYVKSSKKILPVVINSSSASLSQSFLRALQTTLHENDLNHLMPDTNFTAAKNAILNWKEKFPNAYEEFKKKINIKASDFISRLEDFDYEVYSEFEKIYPQVTNGSRFNPFENFDLFNIVELYENVSKKLCESDSSYMGLFVVYDEFSKYLESSISKASFADIKLLQDFAEKCNRAASLKNTNQLHLLLISHKEFSNYIDTLPKEKIDGWKGVSERFSHIVLNSDYSQVYEVMGEVIQKQPALWKEFCTKNLGLFENISEKKSAQKLFAGKKEECRSVFEMTFPLCPFSSFILPRLSEKIAQNERTMFTFLSSREKKTLFRLTEKLDFFAKKVPLLTPDVLYDYFENQMRSEPYTSSIKKIYGTAKKVLLSFDSVQSPLESKIIKTLCLIYALSQFERLSPTVETLTDIFTSDSYSWKDVRDAIENLVSKNIIYVRWTNDFLVLREGSELNISEMIQNAKEKRRHKITAVEVLNRCNGEKFLYPVEYNIKNEMTRYFSFEFVEESGLKNALNFDSFKRPSSDGIVLGIISDGKGDEQFAAEISKKIPNVLVILPKSEINGGFFDSLLSLDAIETLLLESKEDKILLDELNLVLSDLEENVVNFVQNYTHPENGRSAYFVWGTEKKLYRRSNLTAELSKICEESFTFTPKINNEPLNKNVLTAAADKSRRILIEGILNSSESDLGIKGGQEYSFMRSCLVVPKIMAEPCTEAKNQKYFETVDSKKIGKEFANLFRTINEFVEKTKKFPVPFAELINELTSSEKKISIRRGVIPIYLAVVFSKIKRNLVIKNSRGELLLNAVTLVEITENPSDITISSIDFDEPKETYVKSLVKMFSNSLENENTDFEKIEYNQIVLRMTSWYRSLPKYSREKKYGVKRESLAFMDELKTAVFSSQNFLFEKIPQIFGSNDFSEALISKIHGVKSFYEGALDELEKNLVETTKNCLLQNTKNASEKESLCQIGKKFLNSLESKNPGIIDFKFENSAEHLFLVFENCQQDEHKIVRELALILTGINTVDWNDETHRTYESRLADFVRTLCEYKDSRNQPAVKNAADDQTNEQESGLKRDAGAFEENQLVSDSASYFVSFPNENENSSIIRAHFKKIDCSKKALSLHSELQNILDEYAQSVSRSEKRQILMEIVKELCS